jgi:hypothetical protein
MLVFAGVSGNAPAATELAGAYSGDAHVDDEGIDEVLPQVVDLPPPGVDERPLDSVELLGGLATGPNANRSR